MIFHDGGKSGVVDPTPVVRTLVDGRVELALSKVLGILIQLLVIIIFGITLYKIVKVILR